MIKESKIRKLPSGKWRVLSKKNKNLGTYDTKEEAVHRLRQVEYFKHKKSEILQPLVKLAKDFREANEHKLANKVLLAIAAITGNENTHADLTLSYVMRQLVKKDKQEAENFLKLFKEAADNAYLANADPLKIEAIALMEALNKSDIDVEELHDA